MTVIRAATPRVVPRKTSNGSSGDSARRSMKTKAAARTAAAASRATVDALPQPCWVALVSAYTSTISEDVTDRAPATSK